MRAQNETSRERIITATIREIESHGITDFSIRRVAAECGISCAAPYKHFKNKNTLILEVLRYINRRWAEVQKEVLLLHPGDYRAMILDLCLAHIRFLCDNPGFQSVVLLNDSSLDESQIREKGKISALSSDIVQHYCASVNMDEETVKRKVYIIRSLMFGAVILMKNGSLENEEATYAMIHDCINREFDLP